MNTISLSVPEGTVSPVAVCGPVPIGYVGENAVTTVAFDFSAWRETFGDGVITLAIRRAGDGFYYPAALTMDGDDALWLVSNIDTAVQGIGEARYAYTVGEKEKRSAVFQFFVDRGLGDEGDPPDPYQDWIDTLEALGAETLQNAQNAAGSASAAASSASDASSSASSAASSASDASSSASSAASSEENAYRNKIDAEGWAVGEQDGTPVQSGSPYYLNNAKYYADLAAQHAVMIRQFDYSIPAGDTSVTIDGGTKTFVSASAFVGQNQVLVDMQRLPDNQVRFSIAEAAAVDIRIEIIWAVYGVRFVIIDNINPGAMSGTEAENPEPMPGEISHLTPAETFGASEGSEGLTENSFVFEQTQASAQWTITHNLNKHPSVTVVDSGGNVVIGEVQYVNENTLVCTFSGAFSGRAYLN